MNQPICLLYLQCKLILVQIYLELGTKGVSQIGRELDSKVVDLGGQNRIFGSWSRVIVYCSKLSFCQNDSPIALGDYFGSRNMCSTMINHGLCSSPIKILVCKSPETLTLSDYLCLSLPEKNSSCSHEQFLEQFLVYL